MVPKGVVIAIGPLAAVLIVLVAVLVHGVLADVGRDRTKPVAEQGQCTDGDAADCGAMQAGKDEPCAKPVPVTIVVSGDTNSDHTGLDDGDVAALTRIQAELRAAGDDLHKAIGQIGDGAEAKILGEILDRLKALSQRLEPPLRVNALRSEGATNGVEEGDETAPE